MTRLAPQLSPSGAAAVYEACLRDVVQSVLDHPGKFRPEIWYDAEQGDEPEGYFRSEFPGVRLLAQRKGDLGERLSDAFARSFASGARRVAIIGSDAPTLPGERYSCAFRHLRDHDVVIGPAEDGGYYLVGIRDGAWPAAAGIFVEVPWSTRRVLSATRAHLRRLGLASASLKSWYDIDRPEDLARIAETLEPGDGSHLGALLADR